MHQQFVLRVRLLSIFFILIAVTLIVRLYILQIVRGDQYAARADAQFILPQSPLLDRSSIYLTDKSGTLITAASLQEGFAVALNPTKVQSASVLCEWLVDLIPAVEFSTCLTKATKKDTQYVPLANHLPAALGHQLEASSTPGVIVVADRWRYYPGGSLAAQVIGFVAYNGDVQEGRYGLEREYEKTLARSSGDLYANFFVQLFGTVRGALTGDSLSGDIITTIEPAVQAELERTLATYKAAWRPAYSGGVVMDPNTGEIVAMAMDPTFDLNTFNTQEGSSIFSNPIVQGSFEMGSIIKPLTMAAGLDSGAVTAATTYNDTGCTILDKKNFCNYDLKARGVVPMQEVLSQSLNLGAAFIATRMGSTTMRDYFVNRFALGTTTGIDLPVELRGFVQNLDSPRLVEYATASYGQGIAMTPIGTLRALATLANGGNLVVPHIVKAIRYDTGLTKTLDWGKPVPVLKPSTTATVSRMLTNVVDTTLANGSIKLEHYSVAAKTGTAQIANPAGGGYYADRYLHSFFGYLPSHGAKYIVFLFAFEPTGAAFASQTWAEPFHKLTQFLIHYYDIPPDR